MSPSRRNASSGAIAADLSTAGRTITPADIQRAIAFIRARIDIHRRAYAWEIGEHLFVNIYCSDMEAVRTGRTQSERCIQSIAADRRTRHSSDQLRACLQYYLLARRYADRVQSIRPPLLSIWEWSILWPLVDDPESLVAVATWMEREDVPRDTVKMVVRLVEPYAASGGRIEDLLVTPPPGPSPASPAGRILRMARVAARWLRTGPAPSSAARREALRIIADIERLLAAPAR